MNSFYKQVCDAEGPILDLKTDDEVEAFHLDYPDNICWTGVVTSYNPRGRLYTVRKLSGKDAGQLRHFNKRGQFINPNGGPIPLRIRLKTSQKSVA